MKAFNLLNGDAEIETTVLTKMNKTALEMEWTKYYWSTDFSTTDIFVRRMKNKGFQIEKTKQTSNEGIEVV
jgi:hypothetical protein